MTRLSLIAATCLCAGLAHAEEVDWPLYMETAHTAAAIASAMTLLGPCGEPIVSDAVITGSEHRLSFSCFDDEGETSVFLFFEDFGGFLMPQRYDIAG